MTRTSILASAIALALAACGPSTTPPAEAPAETPPPVTETAPAPAAPPAAPIAGGKPAVVADCATTIESNDAMQYSADAIAVPSSCTSFTINLTHAGTLAANVMGHNLVVALASDMAPIASDGAGAGPEFVKPGDARVIAHTRMIGGGESSSLTFDVAKLREGGPYGFFCSFPGHLGLMKGSIQVQ